MDRAIQGLRIVCILTIATGMVAALGSHPATAEPWRLLFDVLHWPLDGNPSRFDALTMQVDAVLGGVMVGWGVTLLALTFGPLQRDVRGVARAMLSGLVTWFVVDSAGSLAAGLPANVVLNTVFLGLFLVPLLSLVGARDGR
ncbi:MAG: hypothetical protein AAF211_00995 [Myxococcota bacterium]